MVATCNNGLTGGFYISIEYDYYTVSGSDFDTIMNGLNNLRTKQRSLISGYKTDSVTAATAYNNNKKAVSDGVSKVKESIKAYQDTNVQLIAQNVTEQTTLKNLMTVQSTAQRALDDAKDKVDKEVQLMRNLENTVAQNLMTIANLTKSDFTAMTASRDTAKNQFDTLIANINAETYNHPTVNEAAGLIYADSTNIAGYTTALLKVNTR